MRQRLSSWSEYAFLCFRVVLGLLFATHGAQKLFGFLHGHTVPTFSQVGIGGIIEFVGGLAIALGLFTSCAAFVASGTMAVAYFQFHWKLQGGEAFFPIVNKGELAVLYCFAFLYVATRGAGPFSLDARVRR